MDIDLQRMILYMTRERKEKEMKSARLKSSLENFRIHVSSIDFRLIVTEKVICTEISKEKKIVRETKN